MTDPLGRPHEEGMDVTEHGAEQGGRAPGGPAVSAAFPVALDVPVDAIARPATTVTETAPIPESWALVHRDRDGCGVVVRDGSPIAIVTAGGLAERWPGGGPIVQYRSTVRDVLDLPCGIEVLGPEDTLYRAGRRLLGAGLPALPVRPVHGGPLRVLTTTALLGALLARGSGT